MAKAIASRFKGSVVGAVVGDCLGARYEGQWKVEVQKVVEFFSSLSKQPTVNGSDTKPKRLYEFTDDTAMARSVAYSLLSQSKVDTTDLAKRFTTEFKNDEGRGYGASIYLVFSQLEKENYAEPFGPASRQFNGTGSYGNGGAMRIVPAALYGYKMDTSQLLAEVDGITKVTHSHPDALNGAKLQCAAVHAALHLQAEAPIDVQAFLDPLLAMMKKLEGEPSADSLDSPSPKRRAKRKSEESAQPYCEKLRLIKEYLKQEKEVDRLEIEETLGNDVSALGSVPAAIFSFLRATRPIPDVPFETPFERTIVYAVTLGGDTDTIATMAGAIAGAYYGLEDIPKHWRDVCEGVPDAITYGEKLCDMSLTKTGATPEKAKGSSGPEEKACNQSGGKEAERDGNIGKIE